MLTARRRNRQRFGGMAAEAGRFRHLLGVCVRADKSLSQSLQVNTVKADLTGSESLLETQRLDICHQKAGTCAKQANTHERSHCE